MNWAQFKKNILEGFIPIGHIGWSAWASAALGPMIDAAYDPVPALDKVIQGFVQYASQMFHSCPHATIPVTMIQVVPCRLFLALDFFSRKCKGILRLVL